MGRWGRERRQSRTLVQWCGLGPQQTLAMCGIAAEARSWPRIGSARHHPAHRALDHSKGLVGAGHPAPCPRRPRGLRGGRRPGHSWRGGNRHLHLPKTHLGQRSGSVQGRCLRASCNRFCRNMAGARTATVLLGAPRRRCITGGGTGARWSVASPPWFAPGVAQHTQLIFGRRSPANEQAQHAIRQRKPGYRPAIWNCGVSRFHNWPPAVPPCRRARSGTLPWSQHKARRGAPPSLRSARNGSCILGID